MHDLTMGSTVFRVPSYSSFSPKEGKCRSRGVNRLQSVPPGFNPKPLSTLSFGFLFRCCDRENALTIGRSYSALLHKIIRNVNKCIGILVFYLRTSSILNILLYGYGSFQLNTVSRRKIKPLSNSLTPFQFKK